MDTTVIGKTADPSETPLYEFEKPRATVRAYISTFKGKTYANIREFVEPYGSPGAPLIPTKSGISVELSDLDELEAAIAALRAGASR
jgi:hypothetical protein